MRKGTWKDETGWRRRHGKRTQGKRTRYGAFGLRPRHGRWERSRQADLVFSVTREAVTNVLRHAHDAHRVTVAWDHAEGGSCTVTVRDDGAPTAVAGTGTASVTEISGSEGTGIARLRRRVEATGGGLAAGPSPDGGWEVRARIPRLDATMEDGEDAEGTEDADSTGAMEDS
ncbi:sensor histidine kinase [Bifidobacterium pullorum]|uniref:sensor histidine kinase n=1 Tax=Bifidobacterium pullorum TaxID=78448 RepID=UPI002B270C04|nr:ATP-binding protein [Bifidobacterium pullorum]